MGGLPVEALVVVAIAALVLPVLFVVAVAGAAVARRRGAVLAPSATAGLALLGGLAIGAMLPLAADSLLVAAPLVVVPGAVVAAAWRRGDRTAAAAIVAGASLPWALLWGVIAATGAGGPELTQEDAVLRFGVGAVPLAIALLLGGASLGGASFGASQDRGGGADASAGAPPQPPPGRSFRTLAAALREPSRIGPFPLPELAAVVAWTVTALVVGLLPLHSTIVSLVVGAVAGSAIASEAYLRGIAPVARRATEAFVWLGARDHAQARAATGERIPTTGRGAAAWLARHPASSDEPDIVRSLRIQVMLLAGRAGEAAAAAADRPAPTTPEGAFGHAADRQLVAWWTGGDANVGSMREAADRILPADGEERLRAEVAIALAEVRSNAVAVPRLADVLGPLVAVRERLGRGADGVLRRELWRRVFGVFLAASLAIPVLGWLLGISPGP